MCELSNPGAYALFKKLDKDMSKLSFLKRALKTILPLTSQNEQLVESLHTDIGTVHQNVKCNLNTLYELADTISMDEINTVLNFKSTNTDES